MNQSQIKYARERAGVIRKQRTDALTKEHTTEPKYLSIDEKLKALKTGEYRITPAKERTPKWNSNWYNYVTFNDEVMGGLNIEAYEADKAKLDAAYTKLIDELVLGDNEKALKLLEDFAAG